MGGVSTSSNQLCAPSVLMPSLATCSAGFSITARFPGDHWNSLSATKSLISNGLQKYVIVVTKKK